MLLGGGVGVPPLYGLAKRLLAAGRQVTAVLGFNTAAEVFYADEFRALGAEVVLATADGSAGVRGFVTDALPASYSYVYTCGPEPMLGRCSAALKPADSSALRNAWAVGSVPAWDAPARP